MKKCPKCGAEVGVESRYCDACGAELTQPVVATATEQPAKKLGKGYAVCALVFGILGGWLGLLFGILGLKQYKGPEYSSERTMCKIGIIFFAISFVLSIVLMSMAE